MIKFNIKIADMIVGIECTYEKSRFFFRDFIVHSTIPDFMISVGPSDIKKELECTKDTTNILKSALEVSAILRQLANYLIDKNIVLIHGVIIGVGDEAVMVTAPSGVGKTTHAKCWIRDIAGSYIINGDKPFIKVESLPIAIGTPWGGKEGYYSKREVPLKAICILERAEKTSIQKLSSKDALPFLINQLYKPDDTKLLVKNYFLLSNLMKNVALYKLNCNNYESDVAYIAYNTTLGKGNY